MQLYKIEITALVFRIAFYRTPANGYFYSYVQCLKIFTTLTLLIFESDRTGLYIMDHSLIRLFSVKKQPPEVLYKKGVPKKLAKFTRKHLCQSLFFNKVAGLKPAFSLKKKL